MGVKVAFQEVVEDNGGERLSGGVLVPAAAIIEDAGRKYVFVVDDGRVERRAVAAGEDAGSEVRVTSGLSSGEFVVLDAPPGLADGDTVREKKK